MTCCPDPSPQNNDPQVTPLARLPYAFRSPCFWVSLIVLLLIATSCQVMGDPPRRPRSASGSAGCATGAAAPGGGDSPGADDANGDAGTIGAFVGQ